ncbi:MAG: prepilin-type N-terminal cleavage/methylation domain-containing protein [Helicobacteraceae bacterium CG2_30_36_10]|nr:MAG: prepilin-type N-terminal cleavage/methylation domain-containing protein [Helicobacteraceae bacterium CG2_30_36_10]
MKKAFTMLELVFVIVVVGILAAIIIPNTRTNPVREGAVALLSHIRYAQHLAMVDDKFDAANPLWFRDRWQIRFSGSSYSIQSGNTFAVDPQNRAANLENIDLAEQYSSSVTFGGACATDEIISFDHLGRPILGESNTTAEAYVSGQLMTTDCNITLSDGSQNAVIQIRPETGYMSILP